MRGKEHRLKYDHRDKGHHEVAYRERLLFRFHPHPRPFPPFAPDEALLKARASERRRHRRKRPAIDRGPASEVHTEPAFSASFPRPSRSPVETPSAPDRRSELSLGLEPVVKIPARRATAGEIDLVRAPGDRIVAGRGSRVRTKVLVGSSLRQQL